MLQPAVVARLFSLCILAALSSNPSLAKSDHEDCSHDDFWPPSRACHDDTDDHHHGPHDDDDNPGFSANPDKLKARLPTLVPRSSVKLELKRQLPRQTFKANVTVPVRPGTGLYIDDLVAVEHARVSLNLYRAGSAYPYASCNLDLKSIKFGSARKQAEFALKLQQRRAKLLPSADQGICKDAAVPLGVPELVSSDEASVVIAVGAFPPVLLVSRSPINVAP